MGEAGNGMRVIGVVGWKNNGKTTLVVRLVEHLTARGYRVSTVKHAHHAVDLDQPGKDTWRHREAGAREVILATARRWALIHELREEPEPPLNELLACLRPVDLVLVEGWKSGAYPKLEIWRPVAEDQPPRFPDDPTIVAVACDPLLDPAQYGRPGLPVLPLHDPDGIAGFIVDEIIRRL